MVSATNEAFRNLKLSELERYLAVLIEGKRFSLNDLTPMGALCRIAAQFFALYTIAIDHEIWIIDDDVIYIHPFSQKFFALCEYTGTSLDPDDPVLRRPLLLAEGIRSSMGEYIKAHGDGYLFACGGKLCRWGEKREAAKSA